MSPLVGRYVQPANACCAARTAARSSTGYAPKFDDATIAANRLGADPGRRLMRAHGIPTAPMSPPSCPPSTSPGTSPTSRARYLHPT